MDLRAMLNTDAGGGAGGRDRGGANSSKPPTHQHQPPQPQPRPPSASAQLATPNSATPATPIQSGPPPHSFRDYSHSTHASPVAQPHEYPSSTAGPYASPTSYHPPANAFPGRPPVPPLQPPAPQDLRSPGSASLSGPSPFRQTPTSSVSAASGGYPFPTAQQQQQQQQPPASPIQRHQYGSSSAYSRDGYGPQQQAAPPASAVSYMQSQQQQQQQQQQSLPQTPPVGTPGGSHQYLHQRSLSVQSTPTPTSAHSQQQNQHPPYGPPYAQGSPVAATHQHQHQYQHQSSQPPTPVGPPMPGLARHSPVASFQQPPSAFPHKPSAAATYPPKSIHSSPPPPLPSAPPTRMSIGSHNSYDTSVAAAAAAAAETHRRSQSQHSQQSQQSRSERERSMSVSPKTRVPSLPLSTGQPRPPSIGGELDLHSSQPLAQVPVNSISNMDPQYQHQLREVPAVKRKLDDRDLRPEELENHRQPPPPPKLNGNHVPASQAMAAQSTASPILQRRKRVPHSSPPTWAQSGRKCPLNASRNFTLKQHAPAPSGTGPVNGNQHHDAASSVKSEHVSRHTSPETARSVSNLKTEEPNHSVAKDGPMFDGRAFPWEPSIENSKPLDVVSRSVGDFLVANVLNSPHMGEIQARGVQFEIEAKLGTIIDKHTNDRLYLPVRAGECILGEEARVAFRSSMTENQHRLFNDYLNEQVKASYHRNPNAASRVPVQYVHRREIDRFFELPNQMRQRLPACVSSLLQSNLPVKARVSYDQKTGTVLAKIVKARVADFHIHLPHLLLDCRISINLEWEWDGPAEEIEHNQIPNRDRMPDRVKDRLSYKHGFYQIDLTQVTQGPQPHGGTTKEHELEIEMDSSAVIEHGRLLMEGEPNKYTELVDGLVDNIRMLARRCPPAHA
ncbi:CYTH-like domain-containing protein [Biscogniauxia sp. FL1348]|nr:CYTH-like domain-containing protein [Biscogniauxia sp. FL1348]